MGNESGPSNVSIQIDSHPLKGGTEQMDEIQGQRHGQGLRTVSTWDWQGKNPSLTKEIYLYFLGLGHIE